MRVSEVRLPSRIETDTDAYRVLEDENDRARYIDGYGDYEVKYDTAYDVYRVPELKNKIESYTQAKAKYCKIHGSE